MQASGQFNMGEIQMLLQQMQQMQQQTKEKEPKSDGFKRVLKGVGRVIDSAIGVILGVVGGALVGAGEFAAIGIKAGAISLANDPWTINYDYTKKRGYTTMGKDVNTPENDDEATEENKLQ